MTSSRLAAYEAEARAAVHGAKLGGFIEAAEKAEFKGNKKRALDQYQEALYFLKTDDIADDSQASEIARIAAKVEKLGGSTPAS
ncbi:MAG: hypothetical protein GX624_03990 [Actinobacteria bacterium]|nr:hypothetical protein [Actinomycetota bacterium]